jgi:hypothetical protein
MTTLSLALLSSVLGAAPHVEVTASYLPPPKAGSPAAIEVTLLPLTPDIQVNETPAPRLALDPRQKVLVDKQPPPPRSTPAFDPDTARYLDPAVPVRFKVALAPGAPKGVHDVRATVTYFYCSKSEGWCRKGKAEVDVPVRVP